MQAAVRHSITAVSGPSHTTHCTNGCCPRAQVLTQKQNLLNILSRTTGHSTEKLDKVGACAGVQRAWAWAWVQRAWAWVQHSCAWMHRACAWVECACTWVHRASACAWFANGDLRPVGRGEQHVSLPLPLHPTASCRPCPCVPQDMQRPLYMQPKDALAYGIIDGIVSCCFGWASALVGLSCSLHGLRVPDHRLQACTKHQSGAGCRM